MKQAETIKPLIDAISDLEILGVFHQIIADARQYQYNETAGKSLQYASWAKCEDYLIARVISLGGYPK